MPRETVAIEADVLIIGGGTAGCLAAYEARQEGGPDLRIVILEKAFIRNSGCLAAGMNALNMYLNQGTPSDYVAYARYDLCGAPLREDILLEIAGEVNETVALMDRQGLPIKRRRDGRYLNRGKWNVEVNGSLLKPITASMAALANAVVYNRVYVTDLIKQNGRVVGCVGFGVRDGCFYVARARSVLIAAGGCAGLWSPRRHGDAHHRIWYFPFNCGGSYALCKRSGAKMVGFEMRVVPLRTKDTCSPTGTLAIGMGAPLVNVLGEAFLQEREDYRCRGGHNAPTPIRVLAFTRETQQHRGPIYFDTRLGDPKRVAALKCQYLEMAPSMVLYWVAHGLDPRRDPVEVDVGDPNILGAHAASAGAWTLGTSHMTTVEGLFVSGDALGGTPSRFISGCWTCGRLAARNMVAYLREKQPPLVEALDPSTIQQLQECTFAPMDRYAKSSFFTNGQPREGITPRQMEDRMQTVMEEYCGGRSRWYCVNASDLALARRHINLMRREQLSYLVARDLHDLQLAWDVINRLDVCQLVIEHIDFRKETRLPGFINRTDYPGTNDQEFDCFVCSEWNADSDELTMSKEPYVQIVPGERTTESL